MLIIARDAAEPLRRALCSLEEVRRSVASEVVVHVDDRSDAATEEVALRFGARCARGCFEGFGAFKEAGRRRCAGRWILSLDADEVLDRCLRRSVVDAARGPADFGGAVSVLTRVGEAPLRRGPWSRVWRVRLFPRELGHWEASEVVHEAVRLSAPTRRLEGTLHHASFADVAELRRKLLSYARLSAAMRGGERRWARGVAGGVWGAARHLVAHGGLAQGRLGWSIAAASGEASLARWTAGAGGE